MSKKAKFNVPKITSANVNEQLLFAIFRLWKLGWTERGIANLLMQDDNIIATIISHLHPVTGEWMETFCGPRYNRAMWAPAKHTKGSRCDPITYSTPGSEKTPIRRNYGPYEE